MVIFVALEFMRGIEFILDDSKTPAPDLVKQIIACLTHQLLIVSCGTHGNVIRLMPPLIISKSELDLGLTHSTMQATVIIGKHL